MQEIVETLSFEIGINSLNHYKWLQCMAATLSMRKWFRFFHDLMTSI
jgi:hypothetical protein